jgi:MFS family permease
MDSGPLIEPIPPERPAAGESPYAVLQHRDFSLYLAARFIAALGQQMLTVAVGWELYERTHLSLALGMVGLTQMVPMVLLILPAGHVADNYERKRTILGMVFLATLSSTGLAADFSTGWPRALDLRLSFCGRSGAHIPSGRPARRFLPQLVPRRIFSRAVTVEHRGFSSLRPCSVRLPAAP